MGVAVATSRILKKMGVNFGILGTKEGCCGESIQKVGSDQLSENLTRNNIEVFNQAGVKDVIVTSPHCYVTFNNKYPKKGGRFKVTHFTQYLAEQLDKGKLQFSKELCKKVVYHDPCYLGRHSGIYEEPRKVLSSIPGVTLMDEVNSRENSLCCGGGGGRIWMETKKGERFSDMLVKQAVELGAEVLVTACPYCIVNFKDSVLAIGGEDILEIRDISEIVQEAI
jgi:Fe-S oxidoreductase